MRTKYTLWNFSDIALEFNTDEEILQYLNDNNIEYEIVSYSSGKYISIKNSRYFVIPGLLYFLQEEK